MLCEHEVAGLIAGASGKVYVYTVLGTVFVSCLVRVYNCITTLQRWRVRGDNDKRDTQWEQSNVSMSCFVWAGPGGVGDYRRCAPRPALAERMDFTPSQCCSL